MQAKSRIYGKSGAIHAGQISIIKAMCRALQMEDKPYRQMLSDAYGVNSSKDLNAVQASQFINVLEQAAITAGVWTPRVRKIAPAAPPVERPGMATNRQIWKIRNLWEKVSRATDDEAREAALKSFVRNRFNVQGLSWLEGKDAHKVICTLEVMQKQPQKAAA